MVGYNFPCNNVGTQKDGKLITDIYSFKCLLNQAYILEVEHHKFNIYIIKFYQKNHRDSKFRYNLLNNQNLQKHPLSAKNFLFILNTITKAVISTYSQNKKASFGFVGAPTKYELKLKTKKKGRVLSELNDDGTVAMSKRFNVYSDYVKRYFSPNQFEHVEIRSSSCYMLKSNANTTLSRDDVEDFFYNYFNTYE